MPSPSPTKPRPTDFSAKCFALIDRPRSSFYFHLRFAITAFTNRHLFHHPSCFPSIHGISFPFIFLLGRFLACGSSARGASHLSAITRARRLLRRPSVPPNKPSSFGDSSSIHNHTAVLEPPSSCLVNSPPRHRAL